jgi:hypothetical protein
LHARFGALLCRSVQLFSVGVEAHGVIAIGQLATGVVAIGQLATGVIAVGQLARGVIAFGQLAVGVVAVGQVGVGLFYGGGMLGVGGLAGGLLPGGLFGTLSFGDLRRARFSSIERRRRIGPVAGVGFAAVGGLVFLAALGPLWDALYGIGGVLHVRS